MTENRRTRGGKDIYEHGRVCFPPGFKIVKLGKAEFRDGYTL
jgi:hypothetical protein